MSDMSSEAAYFEIKKTLNVYRLFRLGAIITNNVSSKMVIVLMAILGMKLVSYVVPVENRIVIQMALLAAAFVTVAIMVIKKSYSILESAIDADKQFKFKEQLSTAVELYPGSNETNIHKKLIQKAAKRCKEFRPREGFFIDLNTPIKINITILLILVVLYFIPSRMDKIVEQRRHLGNIKNVTASKIEEFKKDIPALKLNKKEESRLMKELDEILKDIQTANSTESLVAKLNKYQETIKKSQSLETQNATSTMKALSDSFSGNAELRELSAAIKQSDKDGIEQSLKEIEKKLLSNGFDDKQMDQLSKSFSVGESIAQQSGDNDLARTLSGLASALKNSDKAQATGALSKLEKIIGQRVDQSAKENANALLASKIDEQKQFAAGSSQGQGSADSQSAGMSNGNNSNNAAGGKGGQNAKSGSTGGGGQGSIGAKFKADGGIAGSGDLGLQNSQKEDKFANDNSRVFAPPSFIKSKGEKLKLNNMRERGNDIQSSSESPGMGLYSEAVIPYENVYNDYMEFTAESLRRGEIPKDFEELVLKYFENINPSSR